MHTIISKDDIRDLLAAFAAAIELDQIRVDALPHMAFHERYSDNMWRIWRRCHLEYASLLLSTVDAIRPATLEKLAWLASNYEPKVVRERAIDLFGAAASEDLVREEVATAELFFDLLVKDVSSRSEGMLSGQDARTLMMKWVSVTDPLQIAEDPECGYRQYLVAYVAS
jgi:hypothetical protein